MEALLKRLLVFNQDTATDSKRNKRYPQRQTLQNSVVLVVYLLRD
jgi:hypothetical protein